MRVCPKCGYKDLLEWKNLPHQLWHEYMSWEDFKRLYPKFADELEQLVIIQRRQRANMINGQEGHGYHLTRETKRGRFVHRVPIEMCPNGRWFSGSSIYENPNRVKNQVRLFEVQEKTTP